MSQKNYFEFYHLPVEFQIDKAKLREIFISIQRQTHPDYFMQATATEKEIAEKASALNNTAYEVLNNDDKRLAHLLQLKKYLNEHYESISSIKISPSFLAQIMEINEQLENIEQLSFEIKQDLITQIQNYLTQNRKKVDKLLVNIQDQDINWDEIFKNYLEMKYLLRIQETLRNIAL